MKLSGIHLLLTYQCIYECDHCFVWGSPTQTGTLSMRDIQRILRQAVKTGTIQWVYFEGGEPFLYYPILLRGVRLAAGLGFQVGIVSNAYWASNARDARTWLAPFKGLIQDLTLSSDLYHSDEMFSRQVQNVSEAAELLGIPVAIIQVSGPGQCAGSQAVGQLPPGTSAVQFRGRAAEKLAPQAVMTPWEEFTACPHEDLREPGRVHIDPLGNVHVCQGISIGNLNLTPLVELCEHYHPKRDPILRALLHGGPAEMARKFCPPAQAGYADACHLCYETRRRLRSRYPEILTPDQMYGAAQTSS
ncbi:MAG: hypothetical protein M1281_10365 [Chloroflexi bacterium]|nr:hypothetical protein [Chloroflexota bacterium]